MRRFFSWTLAHGKFLLVVTLIALAVSGVMTLMVGINYDMSKYLPPASDALTAKNLMRDEFGITGRAEVGLKKSPEDALETIEALKKVEGVESVISLYDAEEMPKPLSFMKKESLDSFYKDGIMRLEVFFDDEDDTPRTHAAVGKIREIAGADALVTGPAAVQYDWSSVGNGEMKLYYVIAIVSIFTILVLSLHSLISPILFLLTIGVAVGLNAGTNLFFKEISAMTVRIFAIIQLAVSMDYSIFLLHRFERELLTESDPFRAMVTATADTATAIFASALTTIGGFVALVFMQYGFGRDLGLVMAKGVFFSLVSVVILLPPLLLRFYPLIERTKLKLPAISTRGFGKRVMKARYFIIGLALLMAVPLYLAQKKIDYYYATSENLDPSSPSIVDAKTMNATFKSGNVVALLLPNDGGEAEEKIAKELRALPEVTTVTALTTLADNATSTLVIPEAVRDRFVSKDHRLMQIALDLPVDGARTEKVLEKIEEIAHRYEKDALLAGEATVYREFHQITDVDFVRVNIISIVLIGLIVLFSFKSLSVPILLVFVIRMGTWINIAIPYFTGTKLSFLSAIIVSSIQLGATVDYAILFTSMMQAGFKEGGGGIDTAVTALARTAPAITTSALILFAGTYSIFAVTKIRITAEMTRLIGRGALISLALVVTLLPALFYLLEKLIVRTGIGWSMKGDQDEKKN